MYSNCLKRCFDIILSLIAMIILTLPMLVIALFIWIDMGKPVIFMQKRIGKNERMFELLKFRSMKMIVDEYGVPLPDNQRITKLGRFLRKSSLDELSSLINIFRGDMSIVGPRPLPINYLPWFKDEESERHSVRGGLTGLAQVNGRNSVSWEERFRYDIEYARNITFWNDFKIIIKTVLVVFVRKNIGERGVDAPPDFHTYRSGLLERELLQLERGEKINAEKIIDA